jgi:hypothetical protein
MKIRIKGNSIRYRLTKSEVQKFSEVGYLEETTQFPSSQFKYALSAKVGINEIEADMLNNCIILYFPDYLKGEWLNSQTVGYRRTMQLNPSETLSLLIEKDFVCLDEVEEDQSDNFPNPNSTC